MNKIVKTVVILLAGVTLTAGTAVAAPRHYVRPVRIHHCAPPPRHHHHGGHGHVACGAGLIGGLIGGIVGGIVGAVAN